jgi:hypothetical protein
MPRPGQELPYDASDPEQIAEKQRTADRRELEVRGFLKEVLASADGRAWIWSLLADAGVFKNSFIRGEPDVTAFNEGRRNFGLKVMTQVMNAEPKAFVTMIHENGGRVDGR